MAPTLFFLSKNKDSCLEQQNTCQQQNIEKSSSTQEATILEIMTPEQKQKSRHLNNPDMAMRDKFAYQLIEELLVKLDYKSSVQVYDLLSTADKEILLSVCQTENPNLFRTPLHILSDVGRTLSANADKVKRKLYQTCEQEISHETPKRLDLELEYAQLLKKKNKYRQALPFVTQMLFNMLKKEKKLQECMDFHTACGHSPLSCAIASNLLSLTEHFYALIHLENYKVRVPQLHQKRKKELELAFQTGNTQLIKLVCQYAEDKNLTTVMAQSALCHALQGNCSVLKWFCEQPQAKKLLEEYFLEKPHLQNKLKTFIQGQYSNWKQREEVKKKLIDKLLKAEKSDDFQQIFFDYKEILNTLREKTKRRRSSVDIKYPQAKDHAFQTTLASFEKRPKNFNEKKLQALKDRLEAKSEERLYLDMGKSRTEKPTRKKRT